jgi:hypothetical protein
MGAFVAMTGLGLVAATTADELFFARGGRAELPTRVEGDRVRVEGPGGSYEFRREDFRALRPRPTIDQEWSVRLERARSGGAEGRFQGAWWALVHGLTPEAEALLREAHTLDPGHRPTDRLVALLDRLVARRVDPDLASLRALMPGPTAVERGRGVVLIEATTTPREVTVERLDLLDRGATTFLLLMTARGFTLDTPRHRLPILWFETVDDYRAFLRAEGASALGATTGYYHPTRRLVAVCDPKTTPIDRRRRDDDRRRLLGELEARSVRIGTAMHELVHLLVAETGLEPAAGAFPLWLHEGLAMQFEATVGGRWAGLGRVNAIRLGHWRGLAERPRLAPLVRDVGFEPGYATDRYAAAWAIVFYLQSERPREFVAFLDLLRAPGCGPEGRSERFEACFREAFGDDLGAIERSWRRFMAGLEEPPGMAAGVR